jgi:D-serine deaminase-like pyridoxal phosphate-dependent protein
LPVKVEEIDTPALLVDLDAMEFNLHRMAGFFAATPAKLRPHFKNHKCPLLARKQIRAGAIGMTCATVREAEILVHHGVDSILIANEVAGDSKARRIAELSRYSSVMVAIDSVSGAADLARAQER